MHVGICKEKFSNIFCWRSFRKYGNMDKSTVNQTSLPTENHTSTETGQSTYKYNITEIKKICSLYMLHAYFTEIYRELCILFQNLSKTSNLCKKKSKEKLLHVYTLFEFGCDAYCVQL